MFIKGTHNWKDLPFKKHQGEKQLKYTNKK